MYRLNKNTIKLILNKYKEYFNLKYYRKYYNQLNYENKIKKQQKYYSKI